MSRETGGGKAGSLALEATLILPVILLLLAFFFNLLTALIAETRLKAATDRTAQELSLLVPLCDLVLSQVDPAIGQGSEQEENGGQTEQIIEAIDALGNQLWPGFSTAEIITDAALDLGSSALLGPFIQQRINFWLQQSDDLSVSYNQQIRSRQLYLDFKMARQQLWLCQAYEINTVFGPVRKNMNVAVPLWIGSGEEVGPDSDRIWSLDNFSRGQIIRQRMGANLPFDFPVIARFSGGRATSICSMDLTAPTYSAQTNILRSMNRRIDRLAAFSGTVYRKKDKAIAIGAAEINSRELLVVIPENSPDAGITALGQCQEYAGSRGIALQIVRLGVSRRYQKDEA